ncbi:unnamed protein product [Closterium sp. NIES-53]
MADEGERAKPKPFKAEYAKSARASCRKCKENIAKDAFRIAKVVESKQFDGFMTLWFHATCVFKAPGFITKSVLRCSSAPLLPCSAAPLLRCSPAPLLPCSTAPLLYCSSAPPFARFSLAPPHLNGQPPCFLTHTHSLSPLLSPFHHRLSTPLPLSPLPLRPTCSARMCCKASTSDSPQRASTHSSLYLHHYPQPPNPPRPSPPASVGDVEGADVLRWEDQQALRAYAKGEGVAQGAGDEGAAGTGGKAGKGGKGKAAAGAKGDGGKSEGKSKGKRGKAVADDSGSEGEGEGGGVEGFQVAYAASNRSACRHCNEKIAKGELRVARMEASRGMEVPAWRHAACVGDEGIWPQGARVQGVQGWGELQKEDQQRLLQLLGGGVKGKGTGGEPPKKRQRGAEQDGGSEEGSKRKGKGSEDVMLEDPGKSEEGKMSAQLERALEQQARRVWEVKDKLRAHLSVADMRAMLEANQQEPGGSEDALRERCADGMLFGPLPPCQLCASPMEYWDGRYRCRGFLSAWSACSFTSRDVQRKEAAWVVPDEITNPFVDEYRAEQQRRFQAADKSKGKGRVKGKGKGKAEGSEAGEEGRSVWPQRVLPPEEKRSEVKQASKAGAGGKETSRGKGGRAARGVRDPWEEAIPDGGVEKEKPLEGVHVAVLGRLSRTQAAWRKEIEASGGAVVPLTSVDVDCIVSTAADVEKNEDKLLPPLVLGAAVVSEDYLLESLSQKRRLPMRAYLLPLSLQLLQDVDANRPAAAAGKQSRAGGKGKGRAGEGEEQVRATVRVKGRAAVHEASGLAERGHVLECEGCVWSTTLSLADLSTGANSYYILQVIEDDKSPRCHVFRKWGRVGNEGIGGSKLEQEGREQAMGLFKRLFKEKTGNDWDAWQKKTGFEKQPGKFYPLEIDYGGGDEEEEQGGAVMGTKSKLDNRLVALLMMIFDLKSIREAMVEFEINVREMPLGKLTKRHIERGFQVLTDVQAALQLPPDSTGRRESAIVDASNRFFTLIPTVNPAAIRTLEALTTKIRMLEALRDMEVTSTLLSASKGAGEGSEKEDPVDRHYRQLQCGLSPLEHSDADYSLVKDYLHKTHAPTHKEWELELLDVFRVDRSGEKKAFRADIKNHMLLWHGSRVTNYVGILSQGLRIAPPEAPVTGYMFGKGVYFADLVSKSAQYCFTSPDSNVGLLLLSRVALGALYELTSAEYVEKLPRGKHATKGLGMMKPKESEFVKWASDVVVPCGKPVPSGVKNSHLRYNEFIVYDTSQIQLEFLLRVKFIHK